MNPLIFSYYIAKRNRNIFTTETSKPFKISRSKVELFIECPRCFYLDRNLGTARPPPYPFTLNNAVDVLLKMEFDLYRIKQEVHPLVKSYGIDAVPAPNEKLNTWRNSFVGIQYFHTQTNFLLYGAIDDLWQNSNGEYCVVDYKATSRNERIIALDKKWHDGYKRQLKFYQWLLRNNGYRVSDTGYFLYCNGKTDRTAFEEKLDFDLTIIPYRGSDYWIDKTIFDIRYCLVSNTVPVASTFCNYCAYRDNIFQATRHGY